MTWQQSAGGKFVEIPGTTDILGVAGFLRDLCNYADAGLAGSYLAYGADHQLNVTIASLCAAVEAQLLAEGHLDGPSYDWSSLAGNYLDWTTALDLDYAKLSAQIQADGWGNSNGELYRGRHIWTFSGPAYTSGGNACLSVLFCTRLFPGYLTTLEVVATEVGTHTGMLDIDGDATTWTWSGPVNETVDISPAWFLATSLISFTLTSPAGARQSVTVIAQESEIP